MKRNLLRRLFVWNSALVLLVCGTGAGFFSDPARVANLASPIVWETSDIGVVWSDDFNRATLGTNWVSIGGINASISNNELVVSPGAGDSQLLYQPWLISSDQWTLRWKQRFLALNGSSYGVGVGLKNMQAYDLDHRAYNALLYGRSPGWFGEFVIEKTQQDGSRGKVTNGVPITFAAGDVVDCSLTRAGWDMIATASNRANGQVTSSAFTYSIPQYESPTISGICLYADGGTVILDDISFTINRRKPARFIVIGDSISDGFFLAAYTNEYRSVLQNYYPQAVCNDSSSYNVTSNSLGVLPEILAHQPQTAILMIGGNDVFLGVPTASWQSRYSNLVAQLQANGVLVKHCLPTPRNQTDLRVLKDWISTNYPGPNLIDTWTPLLTNASGLKAIYNTDPTGNPGTGDDVHPNAAGHQLIGAIIRTNLNLP